MVSDKYAVGEYERRFLLGQIPPGATNPRPIVDHYVDGTRLRLRAVTDPAAGRVQRKLGHKHRLMVDDPTAIMHTTMYLDDNEFAVLSSLPGRRLVKTRWAVGLDGNQQGSVNVFGQDLLGLIILEVDVGRPDRLETFQPPPWVGPEVSHFEAFTGGDLAGRTLDQLISSDRLPPDVVAQLLATATTSTSNEASP
ncbi:MAG: hypothetical protein GY724_09370 [Actinomycetia bacterium]|nr:hypothetical protein [Actinomycetes bacterium]